MPLQIASILKNLPNQPGVYRYYGVSDNVLYIGKAKNLKNRVSQYFQNNKLENNPRLQIMVSQIERVEYTTVNTEKEALILEANLIYNLQPKYNILLKDDKSYLYIRVSNKQLVKNSTLFNLPRITLTRRKYDKNSDYFGPYTKKFGIVSVLRVLRSVFPYCEKVGIKSEWTKQNKTYCQYYQLKQCDGICCGKETIEQYQNKIEQIKKVLSGETTSVKTWIKVKINEAIKINNYELASLWRDRLKLFDDVIANQQIILPQPQDLDILTLIHEKDKSGLAIASVFIQNIREGKIINLNNFIMSGSSEEFDYEYNQNQSLDQNSGSNAIKVNSKTQNTQVQDFVQTFMVNYYSEQVYKPEILLQVYENV